MSLCSQAPEPGEITKLNAQAAKRALIHLQSAAPEEFWTVNRARFGLARLHVENSENPAIAVHEGHRERDQRIPHGEGVGDRLWAQKDHAGVLGERSATHQSELSCLHRFGDLDIEFDGPGLGLNLDDALTEDRRFRGLFRSLRRVSTAGGENQQQHDDGGAPSDKTRHPTRRVSDLRGGGRFSATAQLGRDGHEGRHETILAIVAILGVDVGGTFTDAVLLEDGRLRTEKVPTALRQEESVIASARGVGATDVDRFTHGTTIATNALLERKGAETAFVTTAGFEHLLHLGRQTRAHLYRLCESNPEPLVPVDQCYGVRERVGPDGVLKRLDLSSLPEIDAEAVAVCLLFSFRDPSHEKAVADELRRRAPTVHVVASHEVSPEFREYERASTTAADAYLGPLTARYLRALAALCKGAGLPEPLVMRSSGGVGSIDEIADHPSWALVSGPAGGAVGAAKVARLAGVENAISFDMGGTSTDVCLIADGHVERTTERPVGGLPIKLPTVDLHTVGAGGGSIAWVDAGGALRVGPQSAGANPGPACYGHGGERPTVTDANLLLGRLPDQLAGGLELDRAAAERALTGIAPEHVIRVVNAEMLRALRVVSVERGHDPRDFALVAFGGAGPLHACELAEELGIRTVLVPEAAGVLSALGLVASDERRDFVEPYVHLLEDVGDLPECGEADLRYRGQSFELTVPLGSNLAGRFHEAHAERYGYAEIDRPVELVAVRTAEVVAAPTFDLQGEARAVKGPAVLEFPGATCWVPAGWSGQSDPHGTLVLKRGE